MRILLFGSGTANPLQDARKQSRDAGVNVEPCVAADLFLAPSCGRC
jgi:hypothetical protein